MSDRLRLQHNLATAVFKRGNALKSASKYQELHNTLDTIETNNLQQLKTMVNMGCEFYMQAEIPSTERIIVDVGCGIYVDYARQEALLFVEQREALYEGCARTLAVLYAVMDNLYVSAQANRTVDAGNIYDSSKGGKSQHLIGVELQTMAETCHQCL